jgi:hypothetical protein
MMYNMSVKLALSGALQHIDHICCKQNTVYNDGVSLTIILSRGLAAVPRLLRLLAPRLRLLVPPGELLLPLPRSALLFVPWLRSRSTPRLRLRSSSMPGLLWLLCTLPRLAALLWLAALAALVPGLAGVIVA